MLYVHFLKLIFAKFLSVCQVKVQYLTNHSEAYSPGTKTYFAPIKMNFSIWFGRGHIHFVITPKRIQDTRSYTRGNCHIFLFMQQLGMCECRRSLSCKSFKLLSITESLETPYIDVYCKKNLPVSYGQVLLFGCGSVIHSRRYRLFSYSRNVSILLAEQLKDYQISFWRLLCVTK